MLNWLAGEHPGLSKRAREKIYYAVVRHLAPPQAGPSERDRHRLSRDGKSGRRPDLSAPTFSDPNKCPSFGA